MNPPDDFRDLQRLLALKRHETPPPGYFNYLQDKVASRIEREDMARHSNWWRWLVQKLDAQPVFAGAYAFAISSLMLLGFKFSQDLQQEVSRDTIGLGGVLGSGLDPNTLHPSVSLQRHFANPAPLIFSTAFRSTEAVFEEPQAVSAPAVFQTRYSLTPVAE